MLEVGLRESLDLDGAVVVGSPYKSYDAQILRNIIGYQAARFFDENVRDGQTVTLSCSMTIREMIKRIHERFSNLSIMTDSVVAVDQFHIMSPASIPVLFLDRFPGCFGKGYTLPPSQVAHLGRESVQKMLDEALFSRAFNADWVFLGVGALTQELSRHGITPGFDFLTHVVTHDAVALKQRGTVGEISYWPINGQGEPVFKSEAEDLEYFRHVFTYSDFQSLDRGRRMKSGAKTRVVGAAGGLQKVDAIKAACRYLDYLVTDVKTATALLG
jgi:DNA-binding transcriptional regulator LsrR (DeoR family)